MYSIRSATLHHHLQRFFLQVRVGVPRSVADEGDDDEVDAVEHQLPHHEVHLDFLHAAVLELLAEFLAEVAPVWLRRRFRPPRRRMILVPVDGRRLLVLVGVLVWQPRALAARAEE